MTFTDKGHVHRSRVINNSCFKGHQLHRLMNWSKQEMKSQFLKGMAFANKTDTRSYAQVAASNLCVQGTRDMGSNSNDNDISNRSDEGSAGVVFSKKLTQKAVVENKNKPGAKNHLLFTVLYLHCLNLEAFLSGIGFKCLNL